MLLGLQNEILYMLGFFFFFHSLRQWLFLITNVGFLVYSSLESLLVIHPASDLLSKLNGDQIVS